MTDSRDLLQGYVSFEGLSLLERYFHLLVKWNEVMNLTAIVERDEVYVKHFYDSLTVLGLSMFSGEGGLGESVIDVGTGAGLPGIPLAIARPETQFTLCDSLGKRTKFLEVVVQELALRNVRVIHGRAEDLARSAEYRNRYDLVVARAVAKLNVLTEVMVPFARRGGHVVCYKGPTVEEELLAASTAFTALGAKVNSVKTIELPEGYGHRSLVVLEAVSKTSPKYPRKAGTPQRDPL